MRQAGVIAAASLYAFEYHTDRLSEDHQRAKRLADGLREAGYAVDPPETNIVLVEVERPEEFLHALAREGVLATPGKAGFVRLCTHLDITDKTRTGEPLEKAVAEAFVRASMAIEQRV
jgi:threonine aldolase